MSQMTDRVVSITMIGLRMGRVTYRKTPQAPAPSSRAASSSSAGTWVRPALRVITTKGTAPQITSSMMTARPCGPLANQLWPIRSTPGSLLRTALRMP